MSSKNDSVFFVDQTVTAEKLKEWFEEVTDTNEHWTVTDSSYRAPWYYVLVIATDPELATMFKLRWGEHLSDVQLSIHTATHKFQDD